MSESLIETTAEAEVTSDVASQDFDVASPVDSKPDWLPEKYSSGEDLAKAYKELETKLGAKDEDLKAKVMEEIQAEAYGNRPETAGDYQLPDSVDEESSVDNELLKWWSEHSFENGFSQEEFEKGIEMYGSSMQGNEPDLESEAKQLGDNANDRIQAASMFATKFFPENAMPAIERMCESHEGIIALEAIQEALKDGSFAGSTQSTAGVTEAKLVEMMNDPRYHNPRDRDPNFVRQVEEGFKQIYRG